MTSVLYNPIIVSVNVIVNGFNQIVANCRLTFSVGRASKSSTIVIQVEGAKRLMRFLQQMETGTTQY